MRFSTRERKILGELVRSDGELQSFTIYRRFLISVGALAETVRSLENKGLVTSDNNKLSLTKKAVTMSSEGAFENFGSSERPWRKCPEKLKRPSLDWREPYVPKQSELSPDMRESNTRRFGLFFWTRGRGRANR